MLTKRVIDLVRMYPLLIEQGLDIQDAEIETNASFVQRDILQQHEPVEDEEMLAFVADQEVYTKDLPVGNENTWIERIHRVLEPITYVSGTGRITKVSKSWVENQRRNSAKGPQPSSYFYINWRQTKELGFWGIPQSVLEVKVRFIRGHATQDNLRYDAATPGNTVNPIVPDYYELAMQLGTVHYIFVNRGEKYAQQAIFMFNLYRAEMLNQLAQHPKIAEREPYDADEQLEF